MCESRPCWGTPEEARKIIEAGFADKMMHDYWVGDNIDGGDIPVICGATPGKEGQMAGLFPDGKCSLLDKNNRCILHDLNLKPIEGRKASCQRNLPKQFHEEVAMLWRGEIGYEVLELWKNQINRD